MNNDKAVSEMNAQMNGKSFKRKRTAKFDADFDFTGPSKKSTRGRGATGRTKSSSAYSCSKNKSRRQAFKQNPVKLAPPKPFIRLESRVEHMGKTLQVGDIVSLKDVDGDIYYAQIRNIIVDEKEDAFVLLTWLVPTTEVVGRVFDPSKYVIGMEEDTPRRISCVSLVCRCPSDYFRPLNAPYSVDVPSAARH